MRRGLAAAIVVAALLATPTQAEAHGARWHRCRFDTQTKAEWSKQDVKRTIRCAVGHWHTSLSTALYVAGRESGFYYRAYNSSSCAEGVYQHLCNYWPGRVAAFRRATGWRLSSDWWNARSAVIVSIWMAAHDNWAPWACGC